jgi:hypothetical protein
MASQQEILQKLGVHDIIFKNETKESTTLNVFPYFHDPKKTYEEDEKKAIEIVVPAGKTVTHKAWKNCDQYYFEPVKAEGKRCCRLLANVNEPMVFDELDNHNDHPHFGNITKF